MFVFRLSVELQCEHACFKSGTTEAGMRRIYAVPLQHSLRRHRGRSRRHQPLIRNGKSKNSEASIVPRLAYLVM